MDALAGLQPHVFRLILLGHLGKGSLCLHEPAHQRSGVRLHDGGKERFLAGEIAIECAGGDTGLLHDLPQGGTLKTFLRKLLHGGPLDFFQCGSRFLFHKRTSCNSVIYNTVIIEQTILFVKSQ